jgi:hypothetical protein
MKGLWHAKAQRLALARNARKGAANANNAWRMALLVAAQLHSALDCKSNVM